MDDKRIVELEAQAQAEEAAQVAAETAVVGPGEPVAAPVAVDAAAETRAVFGAVVALASPLLPYLPAIYTDETLDQLTAAYVPVADKHGWSLGGWLDRFGAEIALVAVVAPLAVRTAQAHKAWAAEREAAQGEGGKTAAPGPVAAPVGEPVGIVVKDNGGRLGPA